IIGSGDNGAADTLADLRESRRTILIWYAYHNSGARTRLALTRLIEKKSLSETDLLTMRSIIIDSKAIESARGETRRFAGMARAWCGRSALRPAYRDLLGSYLGELLR
ncbi:MAG: hypothetical protein PHS37_08870, partial [Candidatus Omnitrophica bacterium]|nr:hypothetical protein [Candidatus Omnitrophota bacterium]